MKFVQTSKKAAHSIYHIYIKLKSIILYTRSYVIRASHVIIHRRITTTLTQNILEINVCTQTNIAYCGRIKYLVEAVLYTIFFYTNLISI